MASLASAGGATFVAHSCVPASVVTVDGVATRDNLHKDQMARNHLLHQVKRQLAAAAEQLTTTHH